MKVLDIAKQVSSVTDRVGLGEKKAFELLISMLKKAKAPYEVQFFDSRTPQFFEASLRVDGQKVNCLPTGLKSGRITNNYNLLSSLTSSQPFIDTPNINFNPLSDEICVCNFYFAPSLAISRLDLDKVACAKKVEGSLKVSSRKYRARNILVGNLINPKHVVFAHYDAYFSGAVDNASGVGVVFELITKRPELLVDSLFILAGNEELSYDYPIYWGRGFRQFNQANRNVLAAAKKILVIDCVGNTTPVLEKNPTIMKLAFPIGNYPKILSKTTLITSNFDALLPVYHGPEDTVALLSSSYLDQTLKLLEKNLA